MYSRLQEASSLADFPTLHTQWAWGNYKLLDRQCTVLFLMEAELRNKDKWNPNVKWKQADLGSSVPFKSNYILYVWEAVSRRTGASGEEPTCQCRNAGLIPGSGRSPGGGHGHFSNLAWRIPWTEEPGGLQPKGSQRVGHAWVTECSAAQHTWAGALIITAETRVLSSGTKTWLLFSPLS